MAAIGTALIEPVPAASPASAGSSAAEWPDPAFVDVGVRGDLSELDGAPRAWSPHVRRDLERRQVHRRGRRGDGPAAWRRTSGSSCWARTSTGSTAAPTGPPGAWRRSTPTACSARRSARTRSPGWPAGIALDGRFRPVVEFMYADFMWVAADQLFNQIGKARHMFGGDERGAARAAQQGGDGHRLRLAALHGPGRHLRDRRRLADRRTHRRRTTTWG